MPYPRIELPAGATLDQAFVSAMTQFESAGIQPHAHTNFKPLPGIAEVLSCHEDGQNDLFIIHSSPWSESSAAEVKKYIDSALQTKGFMATSSVNIISTEDLPALLAEYQVL
ncbi:MAG: hypothetical protein WBD20_18660 [Pirellulaceae bacterium]